MKRSNHDTVLTSRNFAVEIDLDDTIMRLQLEYWTRKVMCKMGQQKWVETQNTLSASLQLPHFYINRFALLQHSALLPLHIFIPTCKRMLKRYS